MMTNETKPTGLPTTLSTVPAVCPSLALTFFVGHRFRSSVTDFCTVISEREMTDETVAMSQIFVRVYRRRDEQLNFELLTCVVFVSFKAG